MNKDWNDFHIDWDLHELGSRPAPKLHVAHGPKDPTRLAFALAIAHGDVPANAPNLNFDIDEDQAA